MLEVIIKKDAFNASLRYPQKYSKIVASAEAETKKMVKDKDAIIILTYYLLKGLDGVKLHLKNDYAKQLRKELKAVFKIK
jgi:hypothetical protein